MEKRRKIFDEDATFVEEVEVITSPQNKPNQDETTHNRKELSAADILDTFAGYLPVQANFMPADGGQCLICGQQTSGSMRKLCFDCLKSNGKELYRKAKKSLESGDNDFK